MVITYSYPGGSSFAAAYYTRGKVGRNLGSDWWHNKHNGPCAPGGGRRCSDKEARKMKMQDGRPAITWVPFLGTNKWINIQTNEVTDQDPRG